MSLFAPPKNCIAKLVKGSSVPTLCIFQIDSNQNDAHIILLHYFWQQLLVVSLNSLIKTNCVCVSFLKFPFFLLVFFKIMFCPSNPGTKSQESKCFVNQKSSIFFFFHHHTSSSFSSIYLPEPYCPAVVECIFYSILIS